MLIEILIKIGTYFLCILSGILIGQSIGHLNMSTFTSKEILEKFISHSISPLIAKINSTHIGNAITGLLLLFFGIIILLLIKYEFKFNLKTLFIFIGFSTNFIALALWMDKIKY